MKKKTFLMLALVTALLSLTNIRAYATPVQIPLEAGYIDPSMNQPNPHRGPVQPPLIYMEDGTLTFVTSCDGCELQLLDEDGEVVYYTIISGSTLVLPGTLSGSYQLQIISGNYIFYGEINL